MYRRKVTARLLSLWPKLRWISRKRWVRLLFTAGLVLLVSAGLGLMLYQSREVLLNYDWRIRVAPLLASFVLYAVALGLAVVGWGLIINSLSGKRRWSRHVRIYCLTNLAQRLPGVFWHVLGRMAMYQEDGVTKTTVSIGSGLELILLIVSGLLVSASTWAFGVTAGSGRWIWFLAGIAVGLLLLHPRLTNAALSRLGLPPTTWQYRSLGQWLLVYATIWVLGGLILFSIINIIFPLPAGKLPGIVAAWSTSGVVATVSTFSPSGFGLREITLSALLIPFMPSGIAVVVAIATRAILTFYEIVWALLTAWLTSTRRTEGNDGPVQS